MKRRQPEPGDSPQSSTSSWSPPELCPYNLRQQTSSRHKRFKMSDRTLWDTELTRTFFNICIEEKGKLNFSSNRRLTPEGWRNVYQKFRDETKKNYTNKQLLQNKFNALKAQHKANKQANHSERKPFQHELQILFGDMDTEDGDMLCVGGIGDRTPSGGDEDRLTPSPAANARFSCCHRSHREHEVDSPPPKRPKSLEFYMQQLSDTMKERSKNESIMMSRREKHENMVKQLLQTVIDDGVEVGSELYFKATELFRDETRRVSFSTLLTPEQRIKYLNWAWEQATKK